MGHTPDVSKRAHQRSKVIRRPPPHLWIWYALGGALPEKHHTWVLYDTTRRTWVLRHIGRTLTQVAVPALLVVWLAPVPLATRLVGAAGCTLLALFSSLAYATELAEHRIVQAGYPSGTAAELRTTRRERNIPAPRGASPPARRVAPGTRNRRS